MKLEDLLQNRAKLVEENRAVLDKADAENRELTAEENAEYERRDSELDALEGRIKREEEQRDREKSIADASARREEERRDKSEDGPEAEYRAAFEKYLRFGSTELDGDEMRMLRAGFAKDETRDLQAGVSAQGGYTVPTDFRSTLVEALEVQSAIRQSGATRLETDGGNDIQIPKVAAHGAAVWAAEGSAITDVDETFAQALLEAHKAVKLVLVTIELLEDSGVDVEAYLARELGRRIGRLEGDGFATGDGTGKPDGIVPSATQIVTLATGSTTTIDPEDLIDLEHAVAEPYRPRATWLMNDLTVKVLRKLKDADGRFLWQPSMQAGAASTLLGYPVRTEPSMAVPAANAKTVVFGDLEGYFVRDVRNFRLFRLNERYMDTGHVGFLGWHRTDGDLIDEEAVAVIQQSAT